ncbi:MAG: DUF1614 domain-containing protein [Hyphomicrobiales bacterium]
MHVSHLQYLPLAPLFFALLVGAFGLLLILVQLGILRYAYTRIGVSSNMALLLLFASLFGSYINIPVAQLPGQDIVLGREVSYYGMRYIVPVVADWPGTVIAVNVGGAVIPTLLSIYLIAKNELWGAGLLAVGCVALICHMLADPVPGVGIAVPILGPPIAAAIVALIISWRHAAPLAYAGGSLGTLIGADLLNLSKIQGLGAPVVSIGGAGTFDGIFLAGVIAVLIASLTGGRGA